jgi:molybdate transport system regulatory protein
MTTAPTLKFKVQLLIGDDIAMGPGKADLLSAINETGSISAAGRALGMSYRRAWMLVEVMNRCFTGPLVETAKGGVSGGGAHLTLLGHEALRLYRALEVRMAESETAPEATALMALIR